MEKKNNTYNIYEKIKFVGHNYKDVAVFHTARRDNILITSDYKPVCINWNVTEISSKHHMRQAKRYSMHKYNVRSHILHLHTYTQVIHSCINNFMHAIAALETISFYICQHSPIKQSYIRQTDQGRRDIPIGTQSEDSHMR